MLAFVILASLCIVILTTKDRPSAWDWRKEYEKPIELGRA